MKKLARYSILSELLSFATIRGKDWTSTALSQDHVVVGDLVAMSSAQPSKWYLSWLREIQPNNGWPKYLLESIEDGELCWWENIGLDFYNRDRVKENPQWQWEDSQFAFSRRWYRVCSSIEGWKLKARQPRFDADGSVELNVRVHIWFQSDFRNPRIFPNWKKVTIKEMKIYYIESMAKYEATQQ